MQLQRPAKIFSDLCNCSMYLQEPQTDSPLAQNMSVTWCLTHPVSKKHTFIGLLILCRLHLFRRAFATARLASGCKAAAEIEQLCHTSMCTFCCFKAHQYMELLCRAVSAALVLYAHLSYDVLVKPLNYLPWRQIDIREIGLHMGTSMKQYSPTTSCSHHEQEWPCWLSSNAYPVISC